MRGPHCRSRTCSHMLHQVTIVFPSSVKTGRSPSSSTPTIVAFVPPGMTSRHDDTTCKKLQAPNPIHALHETLGNHKFRHLHVPGRARAYVCEPHSALRLRSPTNIDHSATHREYVEIVLHASPRSCVSQHRHMPKRLAAPNPNNEARKHASSIAGVRRVRRVRWVRRVRLGPSIQGCMARSMGFNTAVATWHSSCFRPALTHLSYCVIL